MSSRAVLRLDTDKTTVLVPRVSTVVRRLFMGLAATVMAVVIGLTLAGGAFAHGCGTADHWYGFGPHYYEGKVTVRNSRYTKWLEVSLGSAVHTSTWCGCVIQSQPCIH